MGGGGDGEGTLSAIDETGAVDSTPATAAARAAVDPTVLSDRYQIERRLGAGGMGVVYAARDLHLGRSVAVKLIGPRVDPGSAQDHLVAEARAMAKLRHPNLATVFDIGVSDERLFLVMELLDGGTLAAWLAAEPRTWREIVRVFLQAARGLAAVHAAGFVHRDFKPTNVLFGGDGVARVGDFGVARILDDRDDPAVVGTPGYIAPEVLRREAIDGRADQFSFCVALRKGLAGRRVPRWLLRILGRGASDRPGDRWPTMAALSAAVERGLGRRRRALLAAVVVVGAATVVTVAARRRDPPPAADWAPVAIGRETNAAPIGMALSPDGSTLATFSPDEVRLEPRVGAGAVRRVRLPFPVANACRLSSAGVTLYCSFEREAGNEIWAIDVASGRARRRVPPVAAPMLRPWGSFDVADDGTIVFVRDGNDSAWQVAETGAVAHVMTARRDQRLFEVVVSRDGARVAVKSHTRDKPGIEVLELATREARLVSSRNCFTIEWMADHSLACALNAQHRPVVVELELTPAGGGATERVRYSGNEFQAVSGLFTSPAGILLATYPVDRHIALLDLDPPGIARPISSGGVSDIFPAGWTPSGALVFGASMQGRLRIMRRRPDGQVETVRAGDVAEVPLAVLGESILFGRFPGGERIIPFIEPPFGRRFPDGELYRLDPGAAPVSLGPTRGFMAILCAAGRSLPCLVQEHSDDDVTATSWDPVTGTRGPVRARWSMVEYGGKGALSADGRTLAQPSRNLGHGELSLLDVDSGRRRTVYARGRPLIQPVWLPDGTLLAMAAGGEERGIVRVVDLGSVETVAIVPRADEPASFAAEFQVALDGKSAAVLMTEPFNTFWWIPFADD